MHVHSKCLHSDDNSKQLSVSHAGLLYVVYISVDVAVRMMLFLSCLSLSASLVPICTLWWYSMPAGVL